LKASGIIRAVFYSTNDGWMEIEIA